MEILTTEERPLEAIYEDFKRLRTEYMHDPLKGSGDQGEKDRLMYYSDAFSELYTIIRPICAEVYGRRTEHDDKSCTAMKARIAKRLQEENQKMSWNKATEYAAASEEYKEFLAERVYYYTSWDSIQHLRDSIKQYIINLGQRLSNFN
jgi:hypothetical protein